MKELDRNQIRNIIFKNGKLINERTGELFLDINKAGNEEIEGFLFDLYSTYKMAKELYNEAQDYFIDVKKPDKDKLHYFTIQNRKDRDSLEIKDISARREYEKLQDEIDAINSKIKERKKRMKDIEDKHGEFQYKQGLRISK